MRVLIVYYSLSGTTRRIAMALAKLLNAELAEIRCGRYRRGVIGYIRAGYDSVKGKLPDIQVPEPVGQPCEVMVVAAPIWAGHPATPVRAFLAGRPKLPGAIGLVLTSGGSPPDAAFAEMEEHLPEPAKARLGLTAKTIKDSKLDDSLRAFAAKLDGGIAQ